MITPMPDDLLVLLPLTGWSLVCDSRAPHGEHTWMTPEASFLTAHPDFPGALTCGGVATVVTS